MKRFALLVLAGIGFASGLCGDDKPTADATTEQTALKPDTSVSSLRVAVARASHALKDVEAQQ